MTELCLYQTVHLRRGRARNVAQHAAVLRRAARTLFGSEYAPDPGQLTQCIEALAAELRYPEEVSCFVRIEVAADGEERLAGAGSSLYDGYALRSLLPRAVTTVYALPGGDLPTSAREAAAREADLLARAAGGDAALRCDAEGRLLDAGDAPLFAVRGHTVRCAPGAEGVERELGRRAVIAAGLTLSDEPFTRSELPRLDELFRIDHRGVTAYSRCEAQPLMALAAERIARALEGLFWKK